MQDKNTYLTVVDGIPSSLDDPADQSYCAQDRGDPVMFHKHLNRFDDTSATGANAIL